MAQIDTDHETVGKSLAETKSYNWHLLFPAIDEAEKIVGVVDAQGDCPKGWRFDLKREAYVKNA